MGYTGLWVHTTELVPRTLPTLWIAPSGTSYSGLAGLAATSEGMTTLNVLGWFPVAIMDLPLWAHGWGQCYWDSESGMYIQPPETVTEDVKIARLKEAASAACRAERTKRVAEVLGDSDQQLRTLADALALLNLVTSGAQLTEAQLALKAALEAAAVYRAALDTAEKTILAAIAACTSVTDLLNLYNTMAVNNTWPA